MPVPESTAAVVNIPLYVKDELLVPTEEDYSVSRHPKTPVAHTPHASFLPVSELTSTCSLLSLVCSPHCQPLLEGRISVSEWLEDCELLQAAYDRNAILKRLRTQLHHHTQRQTRLLPRLYTALSLAVCCFCVLLDSQSEQLRLTVDVCRQRHAVLVAYVETMNRKYQYRQLSVSFEHDGGVGGGAGAAGVHWFAIRLLSTSPSDGAGIGEEAIVAGRHARCRSHQRQKSASLMGQTKRLLSASSQVQVHPYLPPAIVLPTDNEDTAIEAHEAST